MSPILGRVGDMKGKERVFVGTLIALAVGSLLAAVAPSIGVPSSSISNSTFRWT
jgi:MFS family permease